MERRATTICPLGRRAQVRKSLAIYSWPSSWSSSSSFFEVSSEPGRAMADKEVDELAEEVVGEAALVMMMILLHRTTTMITDLRSERTRLGLARTLELALLAQTLEISNKVGVQGFGREQQLERLQVTSPAIAINPVHNLRLSNVDLVVYLVVAVGALLVPHRHSQAPAMNLPDLEVPVVGNTALRSTCHGEE